MWVTQQWYSVHECMRETSQAICGTEIRMRVQLRVVNVRSAEVHGHMFLHLKKRFVFL